MATKLPLAQKTPPLESGDRLDRDEFERRYEMMPEIKKAELIEGVVYVASPVRFDAHAEPHAAVMTWLGKYAFAHPGVRIGDNATLRLDEPNEPQPDGLLRYENGTSRLVEEGYIEGPPELVCEIAASSASYDLYEKREVYRRNGVQEYIVWRVFDGEVDWFELRDGEYEPLPMGGDGVIESRVFPGLRLLVPALVAGEYDKVLAAS